MASIYEDLIRQHAQRTGIDYRLLDSLVETESGYDPSAVSRVGARGLGQIMPDTARAPGNFMQPFDPNRSLDDPEENIRFTADYLKGMLEKFNGVYDHAVAAYNMGPTRTKRWVEQGADIKNLPDETHDYIGKVKQGYLDRSSTNFADSSPPQSPPMATEPTSPNSVSSPRGIGLPPATETRPFSSAFQSGKDYKPHGLLARTRDEIEAAGKSLYASVVDFGAMLVDVADLGIGRDDVTDKFAASIEAHADRVRQSVPDWMKADLQREIISRDEKGNLQFDMPSIRQVAHLILESAVPSGAIVGGGLKLVKGLSKVKKVENWVKAGSDTARFSRAAGLRGASIGAANSSYITVDTYRTVYEDVLNTAREEGKSLKDAHDEAGKSAMFAAGIIAPLSFTTGMFGEGMAATGKNLWTRLAKGFVGGGVTEFPEEAGQSVAEDLGAGRDVDYTKAANRGMLGVFGAGVTEGGMAAAFGSSDVGLPPPPNPEVVAGINDTDSSLPPVPPPAAPPVVEPAVAEPPPPPPAPTLDDLQRQMGEPVTLADWAEKYPQGELESRAEWKRRLNQLRHFEGEADIGTDEDIADAVPELGAAMAPQYDTQEKMLRELGLVEETDFDLESEIDDEVSQIKNDPAYAGTPSSELREIAKATLESRKEFKKIQNEKARKIDEQDRITLTEGNPMPTEQMELEGLSVNEPTQNDFEDRLMLAEKKRKDSVNIPAEPVQPAGYRKARYEWNKSMDAWRQERFNATHSEDLYAYMEKLLEHGYTAMAARDLVEKLWEKSNPRPTLAPEYEQYTKDVTEWELATQALEGITVDEYGRTRTNLADQHADVEAQPGDVLDLLHGTVANFALHQVDTKSHTDGMFSSANLKTADDYSSSSWREGEVPGGRVVPFRAIPKNPLTVRWEGVGRAHNTLGEARKAGHDMVVFTNVYDFGDTEYNPDEYPADYKGPRPGIPNMVNHYVVLDRSIIQHRPSPATAALSEETVAELEDTKLSKFERDRRRERKEEKQYGKPPEQMKLALTAEERERQRIANEIEKRQRQVIDMMDDSTKRAIIGSMRRSGDDIQGVMNMSSEELTEKIMSLEAMQIDMDAAIGQWAQRERNGREAMFSSMDRAVQFFKKAIGVTDEVLSPAKMEDKPIVGAEVELIQRAMVAAYADTMLLTPANSKMAKMLRDNPNAQFTEEYQNEAILVAIRQGLFNTGLTNTTETIKVLDAMREIVNPPAMIGPQPNPQGELNLGDLPTGPPTAPDTLAEEQPSGATFNPNQPSMFTAKTGQPSKAGMQAAGTLPGQDTGTFRGQPDMFGGPTTRGVPPAEAEPEEPATFDMNQPHMFTPKTGNPSAAAKRAADSKTYSDGFEEPVSLVDFSEWPNLPPEFFGNPKERDNPAPEASGSPPTPLQQTVEPGDTEGWDTDDAQAMADMNDIMEGADPTAVVSDMYTPMTEEQAAKAELRKAVDSLIHFTSGTWGDAWRYLTTGINPNDPNGGGGGGGSGGNGGGWNLSRKRDWGQFKDLVNRARGRSNRIWMERLIDRHYTVKQIQDLMGSDMITKDPYRLHDAMTRTGAISDIQIKEFQRTLLKPLVDKAGEKQVPWQRLNLFIAALHAGSRNDFHLAKTFGDQSYNPLNPSEVGGSGASLEDAMRIVNEFATEFGADFAAELEDRVFNITEKYRQILAPKSSLPDGGDLTTTEDYEKWKVDPEFLAEYRRIRDTQGYAAAHNHNNYGTAYGDRRVWSDHMRRVTYTPMLDIEKAGIVEAMLGTVDDTHTGFTSELDVAGFEVKQAEGRQGKGLARDAVTHLEQQVYRAIVRANRNAEIMGRLWNLVDALGDNRIGVALPPTSVNDKEYTDSESLRRLAEKNYPAEPSEMAIPRRFQQQSKPFVFRMKMGDEVKAVIIYDASLAVALSNQQTSKQLDLIFSTINDKSSYVRRMFTSWNPAFTLTNFIREVANARIQARSIKGLTPEQQKAVTKSVNLSSGYKWGMAYWREERNPDEKLSDMEPEEARIRDMIRRLRAAGMHSAFHQMRTPEEVAHEMEVASRQIRHIGERKGLRGTIRRGFATLTGLLEDAANASENGVRAVVAAETAIALSDNFIANGMPEEEAQQQAINIAASAGKELSVNFQRFGTWGSRLNTMYFFYNPSIQGLYRAKQALHHKGVRHIAFGIGMTGVAMALLNRMLAGDDDDGRNIYETSIPDWKRERNMIIMSPAGDGRHISIPLPYMYNLPYMIGDKLVSAIMGAGDRNETREEALTKFLTRLPAMALQNLSPITSNSLARAIVPSVAEPAYDVAKNQSWFNTYINPPKNIYDPAPVPDAFNISDPDKDKTWQFLAQMASTSSEFEKGMIDVSPGTLKYLFKYYTGGAGSFVPRLVEAAFLMVSGEPDESIRTAPIIRRFYGLGGSAPDDKARYYELRTRLAQLDKQREGFREGFSEDPAAYKMFMELEGHNFSSGIMAQFKFSEKRVRLLSRQRNKLRKKEGKTAAEQRRIDILDERLIDTMVQFNEQYFEKISMEDF